MIEDDFEQTSKILDRMTLYEIVDKHIEPGQKENSYSWTKGFIDHINIIGQIMREEPELVKI